MEEEENDSFSLLAPEEVYGDNVLLIVEMIYRKIREWRKRRKGKKSK